VRNRAIGACRLRRGTRTVRRTGDEGDAPNDQLGQLVERYWDEHLGKDNAISPQFLADSLSIERRYLAEVLNVPGKGWTPLRADLRHL